METIAQVFESTAYFLLNPFAWLVAVAVAQRTGILHRPVIAAVGTQLLLCVLLIGMVAMTDRPFPAHHIVFLMLLPGALSGLLISAPVLMITKRRRLKRFLTSRNDDGVAYQKEAGQTL